MSRDKKNCSLITLSAKSWLILLLLVELLAPGCSSNQLGANKQSKRHRYNAKSDL